MSWVTALEYGGTKGEVQDDYFHSRYGCKLKAYTCDPIQCSLHVGKPKSAL